MEANIENINVCILCIYIDVAYTHKSSLLIFYICICFIFHSSIFSSLESHHILHIFAKREEEEILDIATGLVSSVPR